MHTLIIVILIGVSCLCYVEMTFADITIDGETVRVEIEKKPSSCPTTPTRSTQTHGYRISCQRAQA